MPGRANKTTVIDTCARRLRALASYVEGTSTIAVNGRKLAHADVVASYRRCLDARATVARLRAQLEEALGAVAETDANRLETDTALRAWVRAEFGVESKEAIDFGFTPPRKPELTVDAKALAAARRKATRAARGTMGKRQKEEIRGTLVPPPPPLATGAATMEARGAETPHAPRERP